MNSSKLLLLPLFFGLLFSQCKDKELELLPSATSKGANTFGCLMNGEAWPMGRPGYLTNSAGYWNGTLEIYYRIQDDPFSMSINESFVLIAKKVYAPGEYFILFNDSKNGHVASKYQGIHYHSGDLTNFNGYAVLKISRLDTSGSVKIVSGAFNFSLLDETGSSKLKVTKGRFDFAFL